MPPAMYYQKNKKRIQARAKIYYEKNKEKMRVLAKAYYQKNKERIKLKANAWYSKHPKLVAARASVWRRSNPEQYDRILKRSRARDPQRRKDVVNASAEKSRKTLSDGYVRKTIKCRSQFRSADIPQDMVEAKRIQILIKREIRRD